MEKYTCPMHPEIKSPKSGRCPKCGMSLIKINHTSNQISEKTSKLNTYKPLFIIIGLITLVTVAIGIKNLIDGVFSLEEIMTNFMAGFFLVFSGFKLLDLEGFAKGYQNYDLLARKIPTYGLIYPFLELGLGLGYLIRIEPIFYLNILTVLLMSFSGLGVLESMSKKRKFQCACLGTIIKVPLTSITLLEDFGMAAMALLMIILR